MRPEPGQLIANKYRLERPLARGGMGALWVARHLELDVDVALKFSREEEDLDSQREQRFKREAQAAARLKSPHIVQIHDYGLHEGVPYIAMELLTGEDLGALLDREGRLPLPRALGWLRQAGKALRVVHRAGIVHRDVKPSNLFLAESGGETVLKMLDFGIAKTPRESGQTTSTGLILGSPAYMSPEQARGNPIDARSDLWSLAAVFYRMITGSAPFEGSSSGDILVRVCTEEVLAPSCLVPELGETTDAFFRRALTRNPARRFTSVDELVEAANELSSEAPESDSADAELRAFQPGPAVPGRMTPTASLRAPAADVQAPEDGDAPSAGEVWVDFERRSSSERLPAVETTQPSPAGRKEMGRRSRALWIASGGLVVLVGSGAFVQGWRSTGKEPAVVHELASTPPGAMPSSLTPSGFVEGGAGDARQRVGAGEEPQERGERTDALPAQADVRLEGKQQRSPVSSGAAPAPPPPRDRSREARAPEPLPSSSRADPVFGLPVSDP